MNKRRRYQRKRFQRFVKLTLQSTMVTEQTLVTTWRSLVQRRSQAYAALRRQRSIFDISRSSND